MHSLMEGLSNNHGDGYENVTQTLNSRCLKRYRAYSISFNLSYVRLNSEGLYQSSGKEKKEVVVLCSRPQQNVKVGTFTLQPRNDG